jgi:hypothetical protein
MANLDSTVERLKQARQRATTRERKVTAQEINSDAIDLSDAVLDITVEMLAHGARLSLGVADGAAEVWARLSYPIGCDAARRGQVAFMTGGTGESAICKIAQCIPEGDNLDYYWKNDRYARE